MDKIARVLDEKYAQLWINHDDGPIRPFNRLELKKKKIEVATARPYRAVACEKLS